MKQSLLFLFIVYESKVINKGKCEITKSTTIICYKKKETKA